MRSELKLLALLIKDFAPAEYEYEVEDENADRSKDYDDRVDILPVSDPNASTLAQRIMQHQAAMQLAQQAPDVYDRKELHRQMIEVLGIKNAEKIVPLDEDMKPRDPVTENMSLLSGKPVKTFLEQDHQAHITVHMAAIEDPKIQALMEKSPMARAIQQPAAAHIQEHIGYQYRVEIESQLGVALPHPEEELPLEQEAHLSKLVQDAASKVLQKNKEDEQNKRIAQEQGDPLIQIQKQDAATKAAEVERKAEADRLRAETAEKQIAAKKEADAAKLLVDVSAKQSEERMHDKRLAVDIANEQASNESRELIEMAKRAVEIVNDMADNENRESMNRAKVAGDMIKEIMNIEERRVAKERTGSEG
jgi:hypothetical protein